MKPIPTAEEVAKKWVRRAENAGDDLVAGVKSATWKAEAIAGEDNFKTAMQDVISKGKRKKGIEKASDDQWKSGVEQNVARYGQGVRDSEGKMSKGMAPVLADIKAEIPNLPKRGPKGSAANFERSKDLGMKLHERAEARKTA